MELQELAASDFDLSLTGFDPKELDALLLLPEDDDQANMVPPLLDNPVSCPGDLWLCGNGRYPHRVLCGRATGHRVIVDPSGNLYGTSHDGGNCKGGVTAKPCLTRKSLIPLVRD